MDPRNPPAVSSARQTRQKTPVNTNPNNPQPASLAGPSRSQINLTSAAPSPTLMSQSGSPVNMSARAIAKSPSPAQRTSRESITQVSERPRAPSVELPNELATIREMTHIFLGRPELLAPGEKMEQQLQWQKDEANTVQEDRKNANPVTGGLFKGCFRQRPPRLRYAIRDEDDGVDRCPSCSWEIEDGHCPNCGYEFDEEGVVRPSFGGFSDMDPSERGTFEDEDLDADMDLEDQDFEEGLSYGQPHMAGHFDPAFFDGEPGSDQPYAVRRWLAHNAAHGAQTNHWRATHSARGRRQHSYTASLSSYGEDTNMDTLEEEDEDDMDEDSSMSGFIDDQSMQSTESSRSHSHRTPSAASGRRRARRLVESEASGMSPRSSRGLQENDDDNDDDEGGPVTNGRRRMDRAQMRRRNVVLSESDEGSTSTERNAEEERQILIQNGWSHLDQDSVADDADDGEESDGARTTVGWEPTSISNDRIRNAGSLTPTADRPNPNARPTQVGQPRLSRMPSALRGLRHRSSIISTTSTANPEEADDDDSEADQADRDGDITMNGTRLRRRVSRAQVLQSMRFQDMNAGANTGSGSGNGGDVDSDSTSDASITPGRHHQRARARHQEYNPRISIMFAQYQTDVREMSSSQQSTGAEFLEQMRVRTPVSRPRTANRQRPNSQIFQQNPAELPSPPGGYANVRAQMQANPLSNPGMYGAVPSRVSTNNNVGVAVNNRQPLTSPRAGVPNGRPPSRAQMHGNIPSSPITINHSRVPSIDPTSRPSSRNTSRPNSAMGRRIPAQQSIHPQGFTPGLNFAARQIRAAPSNPWGMYLQRRQSNQRLQQQPSTATLRARVSTRTLRSQPSQAGLHDPPSPPSPQAVRPQGSRAQLRPQPSQQRMRPGNISQARPVETPVALSPPPTLSPVPNMQVPPRPAAPLRAPVSDPPSTASTASIPPSTSRISEEERLRQLARELIERRRQELSNNPFAQINRNRGTSVDTDGSSSMSSIHTSGTRRTPSSTSTASSTVSIPDSGRPSAPTVSRVRAADAAAAFPSSWESRAQAGPQRVSATSITNAINAVTTGSGSRARAEQTRA
ncbi:MAG: hypothetical protein M1821_006410 [Bathelium mastoideum]|nr:MAG: hypothetical protein M1821_006410 [Bathelium mastoideum]